MIFACKRPLLAQRQTYIFTILVVSVYEMQILNLKRLEVWPRYLHAMPFFFSRRDTAVALLC
jgi:hypothetical protein